MERGVRPCLNGQKVTQCSGETNNLNELNAVTAISSNDAWAAGSEGNVNGQNFHVPYVEHWNGTAWSLVKTPNRRRRGQPAERHHRAGPRRHLGGRPDATAQRRDHG